MINQLRREHSVSLLCRSLNVSSSGFYDWLKRPETPRQKEDKRLELEIVAAHK